MPVQVGSVAPQQIKHCISGDYYLVFLIKIFKVHSCITCILSATPDVKSEMCGASNIKAKADNYAKNYTATHSHCKVCVKEKVLNTEEL
mgnify:FL=1